MNFSISELVIVMIIAMLVIKPEQIPATALALKRLAQTIQRMLLKFKNELNNIITEIEPVNERKQK